MSCKDSFCKILRRIFEEQYEFEGGDTVPVFN